jgi:hypothetical protein
MNAQEQDSCVPASSKEAFWYRTWALWRDDEGVHQEISQLTPVMLLRCVLEQNQ